MRVLSILAQVVTIIALLWILIRIGVRGLCEKMYDPGHAPWAYAEWVIAPKWPFLLTWTMFFFTLRSTDELITAIWATGTCFWVWIWALSIRWYQPFSRQDEPQDAVSDDSKEFPL